MTTQKTLYEDVVVGNSTSQLPQRRSRHQSDSAGNLDENPDISNEEISDKAKSLGKDEQAQGNLEKRAEKLSEDPYMTPAEMNNMDGDTKEKEEKTEKKSKKDTRKEQAKETKKDLDIIASRAEKILFRAKGLFPFDFFPNTITIDANKVDIRISTFFFTETVTSILLKEIMDVRVETTLFLGKLIIDYGPHPLKVSTVYVPSLWKGDALRAKEIIEGVLVLYRSENIDTTRLKPEETLDEIKEVGKVDEK